MDLVTLPHPNKFLIVEALDYPNPYDYNIPHRHDYFEIILINKGKGEQLIDFTNTGLANNCIYTVYPRQIHLLKREKAEGLVLQFRKEIFEFIFPLQHHFLYFNKPDLKLKETNFNELFALTQNILELNKSKNLSTLLIYKSYSFLQILLISLIELHQKQSVHQTNNFTGQFLQLVNQHIREKRKVTEYAELMNLSADKLNTLCKESLGTTPLKIIHEELLLEIKRSMVLGKLSLKEIAFELNFENAANFTTFVKTATGQTPSDIQANLKGILG